MLFNCGESFETKRARIGVWHPFFPLFPRHVGKRKDGTKVCAWLETVERRCRPLGFDWVINDPAEVAEAARLHDRDDLHWTAEYRLVGGRSVDDAAPNGPDQRWWV